MSGLNVDRKGAMRDARSSLFQEVPRIEALVKQVFQWRLTYCLIENVASMDKHDCEAMNAAYHMEPWIVDAGGISLADFTGVTGISCHRMGATLWKGGIAASQCEEPFCSPHRCLKVTS